VIEPRKGGGRGIRQIRHSKRAWVTVAPSRKVLTAASNDQLPVLAPVEESEIVRQKCRRGCKSHSTVNGRSTSMVNPIGMREPGWACPKLKARNLVDD
jgi:hypothetical protein